MKTDKGYTGRMPGDDGGQDGRDVSMQKTIKESQSTPDGHQRSLGSVLPSRL